MAAIKFLCEDQNIINDFPPRPIIEDYPEWLDKTNNKTNEFSIKNCGPAMDWINSGYIIYNAWEYSLKEKVKNFQRGVELETVNPRPDLRLINPSVYANDCAPIPGAPFSYFRIETDFRVITPPGYSCLVMQPYYDFNSKFTMLPGIIDTDKYDWVISGMGYTREKDLTISPGERLFQIIPFKREQWQMEIERKITYSKIFHYIKGAYLNLFRSKKVYK
jgi:dUTPase